MFLFKIKADATDLDVPTVRSLLSFFVIIIFFSAGKNTSITGIAIAILILFAAFFTTALLVKFRINALLLISVAAALAVAATGNIIFPLVALLFGFVIRYFYKQPTVEVSGDKIKIKKTFQSSNYLWQDFNNIVLKDNLLTLDFKNNKLLQLELDNTDGCNEGPFNEYCAQKLNG